MSRHVGSCRQGLAHPSDSCLHPSAAASGCPGGSAGSRQREQLPAFLLLTQLSCSLHIPRIWRNGKSRAFPDRSLCCLFGYCADAVNMIHPTSESSQRESSSPPQASDIKIDIRIASSLGSRVKFATLGKISLSSSKCSFSRPGSHLPSGHRAGAGTEGHGDRCAAEPSGGLYSLRTSRLVLVFI